MFVGLLDRMTPGTKGLGMIPEIAARELEARKEQIARDVEVLKKKIEDQNTLYQRAMDALLQGLFTKEDFKEKKAAIEAEKEELQSKLKGLDSEIPALEELKERARPVVRSQESMGEGHDQSETRACTRPVSQRTAVFLG